MGFSHLPEFGSNVAYVGGRRATIASILRRLFMPVTHERSLLGTSAEAAAKRGGTKTEPMQA